MKRTLHLLVVISVIFTSCNSQNCEGFPAYFTSYRQAVHELKSTDFIIEESLDSSRSTVIRNASFYSCDSKTGFLLVKIRRTEYIYQNVPISVWENFKVAESYGKFYNNYIKRRFELKIK